MPYATDGELYCDACGRSDPPIPREDRVGMEEPTDAIYHCGSRDECLDPVDLGDYGLPPGATLHGAETRLIGALLTDSLTPEGEHELAHMLSEANLTPYQVALHNLWTETFGDPRGAYRLNLTEQDCRTIGELGDRYAWSDALLSLGAEPGTLELDEHEAWELCDAFSADMEGGHSAFPMLNPQSDLGRKLTELWESVV